MVGDVAIAPARPMAARCMIAPGGGGGYSLYGLTGGPVRVKESKHYILKKYPQMVVFVDKNPQTVA